MWNDLSTPIRTHLGVNEKLLWVGQPKQGLVFRKIDWIYLPASILACWAYFTFFWQGLYQPDSPLPFKIFTLLFTALLLFQWFGRFLFDAWVRKGTYYGITNERIVIVERDFFGEDISTLNLNMPYQITLSLKKDGKGTIVFSYPNAEKKSGFFSKKTDESFLVLELIPDAQRVYDLIRNAQKQSKS